MPTFVTDEVVTAAKLNRLNGPSAQVVESTDQSGITSTTFTAGSVNCGLSFTATDTWVWITWYGFLELTVSAASQRRLELGFELRQGSTVGSGTVDLAADSLSRSISIATGLVGNVLQLSCSQTYLHTGLTVGNAYNVRTMHRVTNGTTLTAAVLERRIGVF